LTVGFKLESSYIETSTAHKLLEDTHEVSIAKTKTNQSIPLPPSGRAFESVRMPRSVLQINIEDVRTSEQHHLDAWSKNLFSEVDTIWEVSEIHLDNKATHPDDVQSLQSVRTTRQYVRTISYNSDNSRILFERGKDFSEDRLDAQSSRLDVNLIKIELRGF
jgi:hypothetical protein